jgi:hypothetical protein
MVSEDVLGEAVQLAERVGAHEHRGLTPLSSTTGRDAPGELLYTPASRISGMIATGLLARKLVSTGVDR